MDDMICDQLKYNVVLVTKIELALRNVGGLMSYDSVVSLGGNCSVAHNLRLRGLRRESLPFDWLLMNDERPIEYLARGFENDFSDFCLKANLRELKGDERGQEQPERLQLQDENSGYNFLHHFNKSTNFDKEYERVIAILKRRIKRLTGMFSLGGKYLLVLAPTFRVKEECLNKLIERLALKYPKAVFVFLVMSFGEENYNVKCDGSLVYVKIPRMQNLYDYTGKNFEWSFMDHIAFRDGRNATPEKQHKIRLFKWHGFRYVLKWCIEKKALKGTVE